MAANKIAGQSNGRVRLAEVFMSLGLFLLALLPRAYDLPRFVTADEAKWVYRSARFLAAFLQGDFAATTVNLTPAVTTTWLGSLGLALYYQLHQATIGLPLTDWLESLPEFRTELEILVATRWPVVVVTSAGVVVIFWLTCRLFNPAVAFVTAVFIALDPQTVALSRILGHDAPTAVFMILSLLLLLWAVDAAQPPRRGNRVTHRQNESHPAGMSAAPWVTLALSGVCAGLAFLSKAPALFLIPFAGLIFLSKVWRRNVALYFWLKRFLVWGAVAYLTFLAVWPAAWVDPLGRPLAVVQNAFLSATDQEEADAEGYWRVPDLGPFYYFVNGSFKLSPLVMVGAGIAVFGLIRQQNRLAKQDIDDIVDPDDRHGEPINDAGQSSSHPPAPMPADFPTFRAPLLWLFIFVVLFTVFMTFGDKRSGRYILPAFPALSVIAAFGWLSLYQRVRGAYQAAHNSAAPASIRRVPAAILNISSFKFCALLMISALVVLLPYAPYYFTYFNPLLGGAYTAPYLVKVGWGEGLDQVGRYLQRELRDSRVGTAYASTVAPFFKGDLSGVSGKRLDYVVLYRKQIQAGEPSPTYIRYFEQMRPIFSVNLDGINYADIYPGPAVEPALALTPGFDPAILPKPIGFRLLDPYGAIGQLMELDVLWLADDPLPDVPSTVTLEPLSVFEFSHDGHDHGEFTVDPASIDDRARGSAKPAIAFAEGAGYLARLADNLVVSHHRLTVPADLPRGLYALRVDGRPLGEIELRQFQAPPEMGQTSASFEGQIALSAYQFGLTEDYVSVTIAWQAQKSRLPDYTVFVQLLNAETNERVAGVDTQPVQGEWPTSRWVKGEVVIDTYFVAVPPNVSPNSYKVIVGLYQPETGRRLRLAAGQDHWVLPWTLIREE